jgi:hypothetical protein
LRCDYAECNRVYFISLSRKIRLIASGLDGFGSGCFAIQASRAASNSGYKRRPMFGPMPVFGRPRSLFPVPVNIMSVAEHNPSRRALLGAAAMLPLMGGSDGADAAPRPLHHSPAANGPPPRSGEDLWRRLLAEFRGASAAVAECERRTAGAPWAAQAAIEEEYGGRLDALYAALRRLLRAPAPDLAALAMKIELVIDHEVATLNGGEACLAALRRDARRFAGAWMGTVSA